MTELIKNGIPSIRFNKSKSVYVIFSGKKRTSFPVFNTEDEARVFIEDAFDKLEGR